MAKLKSGWEGSKADKALDKKQRSRGIKEGSAKDMAIDKKAKKKYGYK